MSTQVESSKWILPKRRLLEKLWTSDTTFHTDKFVIRHSAEWLPMTENCHAAKCLIEISAVARQREGLMLSIYDFIILDFNFLFSIFRFITVSCATFCVTFAMINDTLTLTL